MVDVSEKSATERIATAEAIIVISQEAFDLVAAGEIKKGDVFMLLVENSGPGGYYTEIARPFCLGKAPQALKDLTSLIVEAQTDNRNRTASDVRSAFTKFGGAMAEPGAVGWSLHADHHDGVRHDRFEAVGGREAEACRFVPTSCIELDKCDTMPDVAQGEAGPAPRIGTHAHPHIGTRHEVRVEERIADRTAQPVDQPLAEVVGGQLCSGGFTG